MKSECSPTIYLYRDESSNTIRAASIKCSDLDLLEDGFPRMIAHAGKHYERTPFTITFWDHLSYIGPTGLQILGICLYLTRPDDCTILDSPFVRSQPTNMKSEFDFLYDINLNSETYKLTSDGAQAFGSQYFSDGANVIIGLGSWPDVQFSFPIDENVMHALRGEY